LGVGFCLPRYSAAAAGRCVDRAPDIFGCAPRALRQLRRAADAARVRKIPRLLAAAGVARPSRRARRIVRNLRRSSLESILGIAPCAQLLPCLTWRTASRHHPPPILGQFVHAIVSGDAGCAPHTRCALTASKLFSAGWRGAAWPGYLVPLKSAKVLAFGADEIARRCSFWCRQMRKDAGRCYKTATKRLYNGYKTAKSGKF